MLKLAWRARRAGGRRKEGGGGWKMGFEAGLYGSGELAADIDVRQRNVSLKSIVRETIRISD
jgi:hypothetical protein